MFRPKVRIPDNAPVYPIHDVREIDGQTSKLKMFMPGPDRIPTNNSYINNPVPGDDNLVVLAIKMECTLRQIKTATDIDPAKILNNLADAVVEIKSNRGRDEALKQPIEEFMELSNGVQVSNYHDGINFEQTIYLPSGKPRHLDNLFAFGPNGNWDFSVDFHTGDFPAKQKFVDAGYGRFGLKATLYVAEMTDEQLAEYNRRLEKAANG